jgi:hypothetical protein
MAQANSNNSITAAAVPSRRLFLSQAAGLAAGGTALALATVTPTPAAADDSALLKLEEQIFEQSEAAHAFDDEIIRLCKITIGESKRLADEVSAGRLTMTPDERWALVWEMPEAKENDRLVALQNTFFDRMNALIEQMFAIPGHTAEGRRAKVLVLLGCIMGEEWRRLDEEMDCREEKARALLLEFVGGEPGQQLRAQFKTGEAVQS